jgi:hypothetical protein
MKQKKAKIAPGAMRSVVIGKNSIRNAVKIQCVELPRTCPAARLPLGKISLMKTQITAPCPTACAAMNAKMRNGTMMKCCA